MGCRGGIPANFLLSKQLGKGVYHMFFESC